MENSNVNIKENKKQKPEIWLRTTNNNKITRALL
jgi:hypothetical protein